MTEPRPAGAPEPLRERSTVDLLRQVGDDFAKLVRMETKLARQEIELSLERAIQAVAAIAAASVLVVVALLILAFAGIFALDDAMPDWAAALLVGLVALTAAGAAAAFAKARFARATVVPEEAARAVKEDIEWAKTRLKP
jgi:protein-S-isoprenylcysteine O-methyltransferase Ste14